jgi:hypothetical protein
MPEFWHAKSLSRTHFIPSLSRASWFSVNTSTMESPIFSFAVWTERHIYFQAGWLLQKQVPSRSLRFRVSLLAGSRNYGDFWTKPWLACPQKINSPQEDASMERWTARQRSLFENRLPIAELPEPQRQKALLLLGSLLTEALRIRTY